MPNSLPIAAAPPPWNGVTNLLRSREAIADQLCFAKNGTNPSGAKYVPWYVVPAVARLARTAADKATIAIRDTDLDRTSLHTVHAKCAAPQHLHPHPYRHEGPTNSVSDALRITAFR
jgi:hypothetical protein